MSNDEDQRTPIFESALLMNGTSVLGLKSHWESEFAEDLRQLLDDKKIDSEGEELQFNGDDERELGGHCWFGVDVARRMVEFVSPYSNNNDFTICDMGTGNGDVIFRLAEILAKEKFFPQFIGVDYCKDSIRVCECLAPSRLVDGVRVKWIVDDAFDMKHVEKRSIDILLDKGEIVRDISSPLVDYMNSISIVSFAETILYVNLIRHAGCRFYEWFCRFGGCLRKVIISLGKTWQYLTLYNIRKFHCG
jgi:hypothetical protein